MVTYSGNVIALTTRTLANQLRNPKINNQRRWHISAAMIAKLAELENRSVASVRREFPQFYIDREGVIATGNGQSSIQRRQISRKGRASMKARQAKRTKEVWEYDA
jgi:hypothetical protein